MLSNAHKFSKMLIKSKQWGFDRLKLIKCCPDPHIFVPSASPEQDIFSIQIGMSRIRKGEAELLILNSI